MGYRFTSLAGERFGRLAGDFPYKTIGERASGTPAIYANNAISVNQLELIQVARLVRNPQNL